MNIEIAIIVYQLSLKVYTREASPRDWAYSQYSLSKVYRYRIKGDQADNIEESIISAENALEAYGNIASPEEWATLQEAMGNAYGERILGDRSDSIEQALTHYHLALQVYTREAFPKGWASIQNNLALVYGRRIKGDRANNIEKMIAATQRVLEVDSFEESPQEWAQAQHNLGGAYFLRISGDQKSNLDKAILAYQQALRVFTRELFPEQWARTQQGIAAAQSMREKVSSAGDDVEQAITTYQEVLQIRNRESFPHDWATTQLNLASAYHHRKVGDRADNISRAVMAYQNALELFTPDALPHDCRPVSITLASLHDSMGAWSKAVAAYKVALCAADNLYYACFMLEGRKGALQDNGDLFNCAAYAHGKTEHWQESLITIERGRARGLSDSLQRDRANLIQLQQSNPELCDRYGEITNQLRNLEAIQRTDQLMGDHNAITPEARRNEAQRLNRELTETLEQIRQVPGYEKFLLPPTFDDLKPSFRDDNPLIYLITTPQGSLALIALPDRIDHLWLDDFTADTLNESLQTWLDAYNNRRDDRHRWLTTLETITGQLWQPIMEPVVTYLDNHNLKRATLIPTGLLSLFPLHAAWTPDKTTPTGKRYALDHICFTYAPNGQSLTAARAIAQNHPTVDTLLAIENPTGDLYNTHREIKTATEAIPNANILAKDQATVEAVKAALTQTAIAHFACHGTADLNEPLQSGLKMSDGLLTLNDLFALKLTGGDRTGIRLAILSACETGLPGLELADEAIGLPTGLLQAGVAGVLASLWSVDDRSTALLIEAFYHFWRTEKLDPPEALRKAQQYLRDSDKDAIAAGPRDARKVSDCTSWHLPQYPHPFFWAGFSYFGV